MRLPGIVWGWVGWLACSGLALAHDINTSYTTVEVKGRQLRVLLRVDQTDVARIWELDENEDGRVSRDELVLGLDAMPPYFQPKIAVRIAGKAVILRPGPAAVVHDEQGNVFADLSYAGELPSTPWQLVLEVRVFEDFGPRHKNLAKIIFGEDLIQGVLTADAPRQRFVFSGEGVPMWAQIRQFVWLGMEHIFIGYDHILFLMGLIVIGGRFVNLVKIVTSFTIAHSITLVLAALQVVLIPSRVVESVIALSIVYIAAENFLIKDNNQRWMITGIFGLMHGFGFANVLTELGLPTRGLVPSLLSFNVGVEIGQVVIVAFIYPLVLAASRTRWQRQVVYGLSSIILALGLLWFVERAFGWDVPLI